MRLLPESPRVAVVETLAAVEARRLGPIRRHQAASDAYRNLERRRAAPTQDFGELAEIAIDPIERTATHLIV